MLKLYYKINFETEPYKAYKGKIGKVANNLIKRRFKTDRPYQKIVTDITEFKLKMIKNYIYQRLWMYIVQKSLVLLCLMDLP